MLLNELCVQAGKYKLPGVEALAVTLSLNSLLYWFQNTNSKFLSLVKTKYLYFYGQHFNVILFITPAIPPSLVPIRYVPHQHQI